MSLELAYATILAEFALFFMQIHVVDSSFRFVRILFVTVFVLEHGPGSGSGPGPGSGSGPGPDKAAAPRGGTAATDGLDPDPGRGPDLDPGPSSRTLILESKVPGIVEIF